MSKRQIKIGSVTIGGGNKPAIQTMCNTKTSDIDATVAQINQCAAAGAELIRVAVPDLFSAQALENIKKQIRLPLIADIHFDYKLALAAIEYGADKIRLNPGNLPKDKLSYVVAAARERAVPIRVGVNGGSLEGRFKDRGVCAETLVESALDSVRMIEDEGYDNLVIAVKSSSVATTVQSYRLLAAKTDYPLHIGVTEAGTYDMGLAKSYAGIGSLLLDGIGDTLRISLTAPPVKEVEAAKNLLRAIGIDRCFAEIISCPTCARTGIDLVSIVREIEDFTRDVKSPLKIAIMGCVVNGPGEASSADIGLAGGEGRAVLFKKGKVFKTLPESEAVAALKAEITRLLEGEAV